MRGRVLAVLALSVLVVLAASSDALAGRAAPPGAVLEVPGGGPAFARVLGTAPELARSRLLLTATRALWEAPQGADRLLDRRRAEVLDYLRGAAENRSPAAPGSGPHTVPAFLPLETWATLLQTPARPASPLFTAILANRTTALLYHGAAGLDPTTRSFLLAQPELLRRVADEDLVGVFATFGRSLHLREGSVVVPGGAAAVPLWEDLVGERTTTPAKFILGVLRKDAGRLALLYDGIAHLDAGVQRFALGLHLPDTLRARRFRSLYRAANVALLNWEPSKRPFERIPYDLTHLLLSVRSVDEEGTTSSRRLWEAVFSGQAGRMATDRPEAGERLDAAGLAELVMVPEPAERRRRCQTWLFAGRVFRDAAPTSAPDLFAALSEYGRYPSLMLTLERLGVRSPATYAAAVRCAARLSPGAPALQQFQAALAMIERARLANAVDTPVAERLLLSLFERTPPDGRGYRGAVAMWIEEQLLAAVAAPRLPAGLAPDDCPLETRVLAAMAGSVASPANEALLALPPVEWEGLRYRVDPTGGALRLLKDVRARQRGASLDAVLAFARLVQALRTASSAAAALSAARGLIDASRLLDAAEAAVAVEERPVAPRLVALAGEALDRAKRVKGTPDERWRDRTTRTLLDAVDEQLARVMVSLAYAPHVGDADSPALLGGDPSRQHEFPLSAGADLGGRTVWEFPIEVQGRETGWHLRGGILGLDVALGRFALRRIVRETMPAAPRLSEAERDAFTGAVVLMRPFELREAQREALLGALGRGRQRVAALRPDSPELAAIAADAELDEWREQELRWTLGTEPERTLSLFSLAELARLGGLQAEGLDACGTSGLLLEQGLTTVYPAHLPWTTLAGRRGASGVGALVPDLAITVMEELTRLHLPVQLTKGILQVATQDYLETLATPHEDDWLGMVAHAKAVPLGRMEDYVAALTIGGPLTPEGLGEM